MRTQNRSSALPSPKPAFTKKSLLLLTAMLAVTSSSLAGPAYWFGTADSSNEGGAGTWDTASHHFANSQSGPADTAWDNTSNPGDPVFEGTPGAVTLSTITLNGTLTDNSSYTFSSSTLTLGSSSVINVAANQTTSMSTVLAGGPLTKNGSGTLVLGANNTYSSDTYLNAGTLALGSGTTVTFGANSTANHLVIASDGVVIAQSSNTPRTPQTPVDQLGDVVLDMGVQTANVQFTLAKGPWQVSGNRRITSTVNGGTGVFIIGNTPTTTGRITEYSGPASLTKDGPGTLTLQAENDLTGGFTVLAGTLRVNLNINNPFGVSAATLTLSGGSVATTGNRTLTIANPVAVSADSTITTSSGAATVGFPFGGAFTGSSGATLTFTGNTTANQAFNPSLAGGFAYAGNLALANNGGPTTLLLLNSPGNDQSFNGLISGNGVLSRSAGAPGTGRAGTSYLNGNNTYSGGTTLVDGSLGIGADSAGVTPVVSGALGTGTLTVSPALGCQPTLFSSGAGHDLNNAITLANTNAPLLLTGSQTLTLKGAITGPGSLSMSGSGELRITPPPGGFDTFAGGVILSNGWVACDSSSGGTDPAVNWGPVGTGTITVAGGGLSGLSAPNVRTIGNHILFATAAGTLGNPVDGADLVLSGNVDLGGMTPVLTVDNNSHAVTIQGPISNGGLTKAGPTTLTLKGTNSYVGPTAVSTGTLLVSSPGSLAAGSAVTVSSGATLGGNGTVNGPVIIQAGGSIGAGAGVGLLSLGGGLTLSAGGTNIWELGANSDLNPGTDWDQLSLTGGTLALGGSSRLLIKFTGSATVPSSSTPFWQTVHSWKVLALSGGASNPGNTKFSAIDGLDGITAGTFSTSVDGTGSVLLTYTPSSGGPAPVSSFSISRGSGSSLSLSYTGGSGSRFVLLMTNKVAAPLNLWPRVKTNSSSPGSFTITPGSDPAEFFRVKSE